MAGWSITSPRPAWRRAAGSLLFTHRGVTGPAALDVSEVVERHERAEVTTDLWSLLDPAGPMGSWLDAPKLPGACLRDPAPPVDVGAVDDALVAMAGAAHPGTTLATLLGRRLPRTLAEIVAARSAATTSPTSPATTADTSPTGWPASTSP